MALAITTPVAGTQVSMGEEFPDIVGTCVTSGGAIDVRITADEVNCDITITLTASTTNYTTASIIKYVPGAPGVYTVRVTDVTDGGHVEVQIQVFQSEGV